MGTIRSERLLVGESPGGIPPKRGYRSLRWTAPNEFAINEDTRPFYDLKTTSKLSTFLEYKRMELFLTGLPDNEVIALFANRRFLSPFFEQILAARQILLDDVGDLLSEKVGETLLRRVQVLQRVLGYRVWNLNLLRTYKGVINYELYLLQIRIRRVNNKRRHIRTPSAVGSKNSSNTVFRLEELQDETLQLANYKERDLIPFLTASSEDYKLLGFSAESPLYTLLTSYFRKGTEVPSQFKRFILYDLEEDTRHLTLF